MLRDLAGICGRKGIYKRKGSKVGAIEIRQIRPYGKDHAGERCK